jgi:hypothetical protein
VPAALGGIELNMGRHRKTSTRNFHLHPFVEESTF